MSSPYDARRSDLQVATQRTQEIISEVDSAPPPDVTAIVNSIARDLSHDSTDELCALIEKRFYRRAELSLEAIASELRLSGEELDARRKKLAARRDQLSEWKEIPGGSEAFAWTLPNRVGLPLLVITGLILMVAEIWIGVLFLTANTLTFYNRPSAAVLVGLASALLPIAIKLAERLPAVLARRRWLLLIGLAIFLLGQLIIYRIASGNSKHASAPVVGRSSIYDLYGSAPLRGIDVMFSVDWNAAWFFYVSTAIFFALYVVSWMTETLLARLTPPRVLNPEWTTCDALIEDTESDRRAVEHVKSLVADARALVKRRREEAFVNAVNAIRERGLAESHQREVRDSRKRQLEKQVEHLRRDVKELEQELARAVAARAEKSAEAAILKLEPRLAELRRKLDEAEVQLASEQETPSA